MSRLRAFAAPGRYVQGPGAISLLPELLGTFGDEPVVVSDAPVLALLGAQVESGLRSAGLRPTVLRLDGEITYAAVESLLAQCPPGASVVAAMGGGKALDAGKALSERLGVAVVTVPTIASNDSPTSGVAAMYDDEHVMVAVDRIRANPAVVVVDTSLVAAAPVAFLRAGIGDAISKKLEADGCRAGTGTTPLGTRPLLVASAIADCCWTTLRTHAVQSLEDCAADRTSEAVEATVEAVVLASGLAFENGGLSLAHSLTRGLMRADGARSLPHGYQVAWGALVQMAVEARSDAEILDLVDFLRSCGLPTSTADLGLEPTDEVLTLVARLTMTAPHLSNLPVPVDEAAVVRAVQRVDALAASTGSQASPGAPTAI
ncbi:MAG: glycerol dehydrogenase [Candidatus Nanopelagicales bacterium]